MIWEAIRRSEPGRGLKGETPKLDVNKNLVLTMVDRRRIIRILKPFS